MENIVTAKDELFDSLKRYQEVIGASIRTYNGDKYIVILLARLTKKILSRIPSNYMGNRVKHEIIGNIRPL